MVYGINLWQAHSYYTKYSSNDGFLLKSFVAFLFILDTASLALSSNTMYVLFVQNFGDPLSDVLNGPWSYAAHGTVAFVVDVCIQNFFAHRVYKLGRGAVHIPIAISLTSLGSFALGLTFNIMKLETRVLGQSVSQNHYIIGVFSLQVACDVFITSGLVYYLFKYRSTVRRTNRALNTLAFYSINCGAINVMTAIGAVTCIISSPQALYWTAFFVLQVKLYFSSFMAILNSRTHVRDILHGQDGIVMSMSVVRSKAHRASHTQSVDPVRGVQVGAQNMRDHVIDIHPNLGSESTVPRETLGKTE